MYDFDYSGAHACLKKIKIHRHTAQQTQQTMTRKLNNDKSYSDTVDRRPAGNSTYKKLAVQWLNQVQFSNFYPNYRDIIHGHKILIKRHKVGR